MILVEVILQLFPSALKQRLAVNHSQGVVVKARVRSGVEIDVQDQIQADNSLPDFLEQVEAVTVYMKQSL